MKFVQSPVARSKPSPAASPLQKQRDKRHYLTRLAARHWPPLREHPRYRLVVACGVGCGLFAVTLVLATMEARPSRDTVLAFAAVAATLMGGFAGWLSGVQSEPTTFLSTPTERAEDDAASAASTSSGSRPGRQRRYRARSSLLTLHRVNDAKKSLLGWISKSSRGGSLPNEPVLALAVPSAELPPWTPERSLHLGTRR